MHVPCTCFQLVYIIVSTCLYTQNRGIEILQETQAKNNYERIPNDKNLTQTNKHQIFAAENTHSINEGLAFGCYIQQYFQTYIQQYIHRYGNFLVAVDEPVVEDIRTFFLVPMVVFALLFPDLEQICPTF